MWIGFSAVEGVEVGPVPQGEAFSLESCQNWLPGEPHPATAERCVRLGPAGQCNTDLCSAPHSYVCELRPGGALGPLGGWGAPAALAQDTSPPKHTGSHGHPGSSSHPGQDSCPWHLSSFLSCSVFVRCLLSVYCPGLSPHWTKQVEGARGYCQVTQSQVWSHPGPPTHSSSAWEQHLIAHLHHRPCVGRRELPRGSTQWGPAGAPEPPGAAGGPHSPPGAR